MAFTRMPGARWRPLLLLLFISGLALAADKPKISRTDFHSPLAPVLYFDDTETMLTTGYESGVAWLSTDGGATWSKPKLEGSDDDEGHETAVQTFVHPYDNKIAVILGKNRKHWITRDRGEHWHMFKTDGYPRDTVPLSFHATEGKSIVLNTVTPVDTKIGTYYEPEVVYTTDGFKSDPKVLRKYAVSCMWAKEKPNFTTGDEDMDKKRTLCIVPGRLIKQQMQRLLISDNYFKNEDDFFEPGIEEGKPMSGIVHMVSASRYLLCARETEQSGEMALYATQDSNSWHRALFGQQRLEADGFTVMESTNYSIQVDVAAKSRSFFQGPVVGTLFTSNSNGTYFTENEEYTNRNALGFVDFEKVESIQGVAISNIVRNGEAVLEDGDEKEITSKITFDDGREFLPLKTESGDQLHLHGFSEIHNVGKVFSSKAPGLVMGVGNIGKTLDKYNEGDLYVSKNAGKTWTKALKGAHKYEFGDQGSVLVAVYDEEPTDQVMYSLNFGKSWEPLKVSEEKFTARTLTTIPDSTSLKFVLTGLPVDDSDSDWKQVVFSIDFEPIANRKCKKSDFEKWYARVEDGEPTCVMGHKQWFHRRKPDADCFIEKEGEEPEAENDPEDCDCTDADYECDYNFVRNKEKESECVPSENYKPPSGACKDSEDTYKGPSGYRKIPGNTCQAKKGEAKDAPIERSCNGTKTPHSDGKVIVEMTEFPSTTFQDYIYLENEYEDVETVVMTTGDRQLWLTHDHGYSWKAILEDVEIRGIYPNKYNNYYVYFVSAGKEMYISEDSMKTVPRAIKMPSPPNKNSYDVLKFHPDNHEAIIWMGCASSGKGGDCSVVEARVSYNGGKDPDEWRLLDESVGACDFMYREESRPDAKDLIYCVMHDPNTRKDSLVATTDDFNHKRDVLFDDMLSFATMSEFIVVARRDEEEREFLRLDASLDGSTFADARFPPNFNVTRQVGYTVLDSSTHAIFLHVTVNDEPGQEYGAIIKSNSNGTSYALSIRHVNRDTNGWVDFEKLLGLEGAALVNIVSNPDKVDEGARKQKKTMITHNDGADWALIPPPKHAGDERTFECVEKGLPIKECSLHLHGFTERNYKLRTYSSPTAIGMVMGIGNVGKELLEKSNGDTFLSSDGGVSWHAVAEGQYMWEYGDQGSVIVMVLDQTPTKEFLYSRDEGKNWESQQFTTGSDVVISDITTHPSDISRKFILWGNEANGKKKAVAIHLDFTPLYEDRACNLNREDPDAPDNDYVLWTPKHPLLQDDCLFGHESEFWRKKTDRLCYNGVKIERLRGIKQNCTCSRLDFECDYNYERKGDNSCELIDGLPPADPKRVCADGRTEYFEPTGYRRIPLDTCQNGMDFELRGTHHPCPGKEKEYEEKHGISGAALFFAIVIPILAAAGVGYFVWQRYGSQFGAIQLGDGGAIGSSRGGLLSKLDTNSPWLAYPVMAISAVAAALMAIPMLLGSAYRGIRDRGSSYSRVRPYTSRSSFARGRSQYSAVNSDESDLLGEDSDDEV